MPTAMYFIYATVGLHVTVPHMPVLQLYESLKNFENVRMLVVLDMITKLTLQI